MSPRPKLGYLVPDFPGQTHTNCWSEIAALEERGVEVAVFSTRPPAPALMPHDWGRAARARTIWLDPGGPVAGLRALPALPLGQIIGERGLGGEMLRAAPAAARLVRHARALGLHHVHVHGAGRGATVAALAARMGGPTYSLHLPGPLSEGGPGQNLKWRGARFATVATARILNEIRFVLREDLPRVTVQPVGVDTDFFRRDAAYVPVKPGQEIRLFACGRLDPARGFEDLMKAVRHLLDRGHPATLTIAGEDVAGGAGHRRALEARAAELRLGPHVAFLGAVDAAVVRARLVEAHVFVLPGWHEPLGTALMEAMACGVPVVGTAAGGVRELVTDGRDGILVQPKAPEALVGAILRIAGNPELARMLSLHGRSRIESAFDARIGAERLMREVGFLPMDHQDDLIPDLPAASARRPARPRR